MRLVAEILPQLRRQRPLHQPLRQLREHTARPDDLVLAPRTGEQLIDHLVREPVANPRRELDPGGRRAAGRLLALSISPVSLLDFVGMTLLFGHA